MTNHHSSCNIHNERSGGSWLWQSAVFLFAKIMDISFLMLKGRLPGRSFWRQTGSGRVTKSYTLLQELCEGRAVKVVVRTCLFLCSSAYPWWCCTTTTLHDTSSHQPWEKWRAMSSIHQRERSCLILCLQKRNKGCDKFIPFYFIYTYIYKE